MRRLSISSLCALLAIAPASAQAPAASRSARVEPASQSRVLPGTTSSAFTTILGTALDAANGPLFDSVVRLRDARFGRIVASQSTDRVGVFGFRGLDPGSYVVELMGERQLAVLATSELLTVEAGDEVSTIVKLPARTSPYAGLFGGGASQALAVTAAAAAAGVLTTTVARDDASPE